MNVFFFTKMAPIQSDVFRLNIQLEGGYASDELVPRSIRRSDLTSGFGIRCSKAPQNRTYEQLLFGDARCHIEKTKIVLNDAIRPIDDLSLWMLYFH